MYALHGETGRRSTATATFDRPKHTCDLALISLQVYNEIGSSQMFGTRLALHASLPSSGSSQEKQLSRWEADTVIPVESVPHISSLLRAQADVHALAC